jgi:arylsulfatase A-like enzyme
MTRRRFLQVAAAAGAALAGANALARSGTKSPARRPNVVLIMADDLGAGDAGYLGHPRLRTPHLDRLAAAGVRFDRFYAASPVCSPTRASCLTGRHPERMGITAANVGHLPPEEITVAEVLRAEGYATGHFGKWHLGTLTREVRDSMRGGPDHPEHYSPPWEHGFDTCFSTEAKVPSWDPMITPPGGIVGTEGQEPGSHYGTYYWTGPGQRAAENLEGDNSRVIMDRCLPFIDQARQADRPFLATVWFHTPHSPVVGGPDYLAAYSDCDEDEAHYYAAVTAMDEQIGRLRRALTDWALEQDTILWFCSDNGPSAVARRGRQVGSTGGLRGRKGGLYEGGVRVPGLFVWPSRLPEPRRIVAPVSTVDMMPTILEAAGVPSHRALAPQDGLSLLPLIERGAKERKKAMSFSFEGALAIVDDRYKLLIPKSGEAKQLYDLQADPAERSNLADAHPSIVDRLHQRLMRDRESWQRSLAGHDYRARAGTARE